MQVIQYDRDPITSIIIPRNRNDVVYHNTFQLLQFLKQYKMSVLESILDIPQNNAYKSVYIQEPNETSIISKSFLSRISHRLASLETVSGYMQYSYIFFNSGGY